MTTLFATYSLMSMLTSPLWGRLSDRTGRRPVLMISMAASCAAYLWLAFADHLWAVFVARALAGACAGNIAAAQAYIADVTPPEKRAKGMGVIGAAFGLGFIIGPVVGGMIAGNNPAGADLETPGLIAAAMSGIAFLAVAFVLRESLSAATARGAPRGRITAAREALTRPELVRLLVVFFVVILAFSGMETTFAWWAIAQFGWGPRSTSFVFFYVGVLSALMQGGLIGLLTRHLGEERLVLGGLALICAGLLTMPFASGIPLLVLAVSALALGMGAMQPSTNSLISRCAGARQGEVLGVAQSVGSLSRVLGPLLAGSLYTAFGRNSPFLLGATLVAGALAIGWPLSRALPPLGAGEPREGPAQ